MSDSPPPDQGWAHIQELLQQARGIAPGSSRPSSPRAAEERLREVVLMDRRQRVRLKRHLAYGAFIAVGLQLVVANAAFYVYGFSNDWRIEPEVMIAWLSATVVETIGVILIIARNLFPQAAEE